jgi:hypothetical protein
LTTARITGLAQAVGQHQFGVDAVLPADHIKPFFVESLDGRGDQRQDIGLDGDKNDVGLVVGQLIDAGAGVADRLGQVLGAFDDDSPLQGRFEQIGNDVAQDHFMAAFGQKCGHDAAHGTRTDDGEGFGDKSGCLSVMAAPPIVLVDVPGGRAVCGIRLTVNGTAWDVRQPREGPCPRFGR